MSHDPLNFVSQSGSQVRTYSVTGQCRFLALIFTFPPFYILIQTLRAAPFQPAPQAEEKHLNARFKKKPRVTEVSLLVPLFLPRIP